MKRLHRLPLALAALAALVLLASAALAAPKMTPKVDNFILFVDYSGSMAMDFKNTNSAKIAQAQASMAAMNQKIPALPYKGALYTFAPFGKVQELKPYDKGALGAAIASLKTNYDIFGRQTPMGDGFAALDPVIGASSGKIAVILFTDGESNLGSDPVAGAKALYAKYGNRLCLHVVSYADTARGKRVIDEIRGLSKCVVAADGAALQNAAVLDQFVKDVFYDMGPADADKELIVFRSLNFGFDKSSITPDMLPSLEQALLILKQRPDLSIVVEGHTDSMGADDYNKRLSDRRAKSVVDWLVQHGIAASRIEYAGHGESQLKYDNSTEEGRALSRRVEIRSK